MNELLSLGRAVEQRLVAELLLEAMPLPADLAMLRGEWKGQPIELRARAYSGPSTPYARFVEVQGGEMEIANALVLADGALALPIFGADLVALGSRGALAIADLSPTSARSDVRADQARVLRSRTGDLPALPSAGELPGWARTWFSSTPLFARVTPECHDDAGRWVMAMVDAFVDLVQHAEQGDEEAHVTGRQRAYCAAHLEDDRGLQMLTRIFPDGAGQRVLEHVMFPSEPATWA